MFLSINYVQIHRKLYTQICTQICQKDLQLNTKEVEQQQEFSLLTARVTINRKTLLRVTITWLGVSLIFFWSSSGGAPSACGLQWYGMPVTLHSVGMCIQVVVSDQIVMACLVGLRLLRKQLLLSSGGAASLMELQPF